MSSGSLPITPPCHRQKRAGSQGPLLRRHYPASWLIWPCPTPKGTVTQGDVEGATLVPSGPPQITRITLPTCRAQYPGGPGRVHMSVASPSRAAFPVSQAGRHPRLHFRGLLRLHSNYGPLDRSTAQGGLCHRASIHPVTRTNRLPATRSNRQLSGWFLPPLVIRAFWAHVESRRGAVAWALWASLRFLSPLIKPDVRISRIRLPDRLHLKAHGGGPGWTRRSRITPSSPNTTLSGKRLVPRDDTLWRLTRK